jgi:hypothetical protein
MSGPAQEFSSDARPGRYLSLFFVGISLTAMLVLALLGIWAQEQVLRPKSLGEYRAAVGRDQAEGLRPVVLQGTVAMEGEWAYASGGWVEHRMVHNEKELSVLVLDDGTGEVTLYYDPGLLSAVPHMGTKLQVRARRMRSEVGPDDFYGLVAESISLVQ